MSSISKQANGRYRARYRDPQGRTRSKSFELKADAERFLTGIDHRKLAGGYVDPAHGRTRFRDWVERWRAGVVDLRPSTLARDDGYVDRYLIPEFGALRIGDIDHARVQAWIAALTARGLAPATVVKAGQIMSKIMSTAVAAGLITSSPCASVRLPRIERLEMRFLEPAEIASLSETIDRRYRALVLLGAYGGLRIGEMMGLRCHRLDLLRRRVDIAETCVEVSGILHFGPPKTRAGRRTVPLPQVVVSALDEHLRAYPTGPDDLVFRAPEAGPVRLASWRRRFWAPGVREAGLEPLRPHDLRHTAVALWIAAGASPKEIATRAGHTSVVTVLDRYGHLLPGSEERVNDALDAMAATPPRAPMAHIGRLRHETASASRANTR